MADFGGGFAGGFVGGRAAGQQMAIERAKLGVSMFEAQSRIQAVQAQIQIKRQELVRQTAEDVSKNLDQLGTVVQSIGKPPGPELTKTIQNAGNQLKQAYQMLGMDPEAAQPKIDATMMAYQVPQSDVGKSAADVTRVGGQVTPEQVANKAGFRPDLTSQLKTVADTVTGLAQKGVTGDAINSVMDAFAASSPQIMGPINALKQTFAGVTPQSMGQATGQEQAAQTVAANAPQAVQAEAGKAAAIGAAAETGKMQAQANPALQAQVGAAAGGGEVAKAQPQIDMYSQQLQKAGWDKANADSIATGFVLGKTGQTPLTPATMMSPEQTGEARKEILDAQTAIKQLTELKGLVNDKTVGVWGKISAETGILHQLPVVGDIANSPMGKRLGIDAKSAQDANNVASKIQQVVGTVSSLLAKNKSRMSNQDVARAEEAIQADYAHADAKTVQTNIDNLVGTANHMIEVDKGLLQTRQINPAQSTGAQAGKDAQGIYVMRGGVKHYVTDIPGTQ